MFVFRLQAIASILLSTLCFGAERPGNWPPNIVIIVADDLGYGELGCQGNPETPTPRIDGLAASGVRCTQAYVTAPNCSPSRAGLFTGRIPTRFGYEFNPIGARNEEPNAGLPAKEQTLAEYLHDAGYTTGLVGKWHLGGAATYHPQRHGFDEFFGFMHEGHYFVPPPWTGTQTMLRKRNLPPGSSARHQVTEQLLYSSHMGHNEPDYDANNPIIRGGQPVVEEDYLTDAFAREAAEFIERYKSTPFCLTVTFNAVHSPLQAKLETLKKLDHINDIHRRIFASMLVDLDRGVGTILDALKKNELQDNTLVVFFSDNGGPTKELTSSNLPLRGGKGSMYEGGLRVPFIYSWPGTLPPDSVCDSLTSSLDIFATVAALVGKTPKSRLDGENILPLLSGLATETTRKEELFWRQGKRAALRSGDWKLVTNDRFRPNAWELYNVAQDLSEKLDMADRNPQLLQRLISEWNRYNAEMAEPLF